MPKLLRRPRISAVRLTTLFLALLLPAAAPAAPTIQSIAPGSENAAIAGMAIEDFEDTQLLSGLSITFSVWRNSSNVVTANGPVTYAGTLPQLWNPSSNAFTVNAWDGSNALVNGWAHSWNFPYAASIDFLFVPALPAVGVGLSNFQSDVTLHELIVNGASQGNLEALSGWTSGVNVKNRYLLVTADPNTPISSIRIRTNTHYDGVVFDKLALADHATSARSTSWGRMKRLYR